MLTSLMSKAAVTLASRLHRIPLDEGVRNTVMRLWSAGEQGFDENMLRDIGLSDGIYRRRDRDKLN